MGWEGKEKKCKRRDRYYCDGNVRAKKTKKKTVMEGLKMGKSNTVKGRGGGGGKG